MTRHRTHEGSRAEAQATAKRVVHDVEHDVEHDVVHDAVHDVIRDVANDAVHDAATDVATDVVHDMARYYDERAAIYERVYHKPHRQADLRAIEAWLRTRFAGRHGLEIACGTGWWTPHAAHDCASWLATDLNESTLAMARKKPLPPNKVRFAVADAYALDASLRRLDPALDPARPDRPNTARFDAAFAGCWWSHVPLARLPSWLEHLHIQLQPGARVVMLDNRYVEGDSTAVHRVDADGNGYQWRMLDDDSRHEVVKNFPTADSVRAALGARAREIHFVEHAHYWTLEYKLGSSDSTLA
jgi:SAM-dependent methyltransferase